MSDVPSKTIYKGEAVGGPLAGEILSTDYSKGIIIIDRPKGHAWVYDWTPDYAEFVARTEEPEILQWSQAEQFNIRRAMEENNYEVRSHPRAGEDY